MKTEHLIPKALVIFFLLCTTAFAAKGYTLQGKVMQIKDGDTVVVSSIEGGQFFTCRLYGIDTPEITDKTGDIFNTSKLIGHRGGIQNTLKYTQRRDIKTLRKLQSKIVIPNELISP